MVPPSDGSDCLCRLVSVARSFMNPPVRVRVRVRDGVSVRVRCMVRVSGQG